MLRIFDEQSFELGAIRQNHYSTIAGNHIKHIANVFFPKLSYKWSLRVELPLRKLIQLFFQDFRRLLQTAWGSLKDVFWCLNNFYRFLHWLVGRDRRYFAHLSESQQKKHLIVNLRDIDSLLVSTGVPGITQGFSRKFFFYSKTFFPLWFLAVLARSQVKSYCQSTLSETLWDVYHHDCLLMKRWAFCPI